MAFRPILRQGAIAPAALAMTTGLLLYPKGLIHAEEHTTPRKSIYDPPSSSAPSTTTPTISSSPSSPELSNSNSTPSKPTPTERLQHHIATARLYLHHHATRAEDHTNALLTRTLHLEHNLTSTLTSLAPPRTSNEKLAPGLLTVLVSTLAGSIVTRNRNILLRASVPVAAGVTAGWVVIPLTMRNVGDLVWSWEQRWPVVARNHEVVAERVGRMWETGKAHSAMGVAMAQERVEGIVEKVEGWIAKGK